MTRQDLKEIRYLNQAIKSLQRRRSELRDSMFATTKPLTGMPRSGKQRDAFAEYAARLDELERSIDKRILDAERKKQEIEDAIASLPARHKAVLHLRYIDCRNWKSVARAMRYSEIAVKKIEAEAVKMLR